MTIDEKVKATPETDWPVAKQELSGPAKFFALYGGEHIAATEFVIGATLVQYGCSAFDILVGLAIGNLLAVLTYRFLTAPIAVDSRLTLYSYLRRVVGPKVQNIYNIVFGLGFAALAATGICISATAIRAIFNIPIQLEWYPTDWKFVAIVVILGAVIIFVAANGFKGVSEFATKCVPWMIAIFALAFLIVLPMLSRQVGYGEIHSPADFFNILDQYVWAGQPGLGGQKLGIVHVAGFAWAVNCPLHFGLNDMAVLRYAKKKSYGYISAMGMFVGHYFAWIGAGIMGASAAIFLNTDLSLLDSGQVTYTILGYSGLLAVVIAGWTTANPTIYRVALSFNAVFKNVSYKKMTYIMGVIITIAACFPIVKSANDVLTYLGLMVIGMGAVCITEHFIFPKIGFTKYWNMYKKNNINWPALVAWGSSLVFFIIMLITRPAGFHQNFWFIPCFLIATILYIVLAGAAGAKKKYTKEEKEEMEYEHALQEYVNEQHSKDVKFVPNLPSKIFNYVSWISLAVMIILGAIYFAGAIPDETIHNYIGMCTLVYFIAIILVTIFDAVKRSKENK